MPNSAPPVDMTKPASGAPPSLKSVKLYSVVNVGVFAALHGSMIMGVSSRMPSRLAIVVLCRILSIPLDSGLISITKSTALTSKGTSFSTVIFWPAFTLPSQLCEMRGAAQGALPTGDTAVEGSPSWWAREEPGSVCGGRRPPRSARPPGPPAARSICLAAAAAARCHRSRYPRTRT